MGIDYFLDSGSVCYGWHAFPYIIKINRNLNHHITGSIYPKLMNMRKECFSRSH